MRLSAMTRSADTAMQYGETEFANSKKMAKLVLMGDTQQMGSVAAGTPFKDMQEAGLRTAKLNQVVRQKVERHSEAVEELAVGKIREGFQKLAPEFHEVGKSQLETHAAEHWHTLKDAKPFSINPTRRKLSRRQPSGAFSRVQL